MLPSIVKPKSSVGRTSTRNASKEVRFRNFDIKEKVQENFALDNRDSFNIQKLFKDEKVDKDESAFQRQKRL